MNNVDKQYLDLLKDIIDNGVWKETRSGKVKSVFGRMMRFDLKEGLPLLTTKRVYYKGIIHELLWFLNGDTNIKYLYENKVNIWNDDAYRFYTTLVQHHNEYADTTDGALDYRPLLNKEQFLQEVLNETSMYLCAYGCSDRYTFGDLGPVYGKSWRNFGTNGRDQIGEIIDKLLNNPDDRRIMCVAYNPDKLDNVALPPCHVMFQFYTRELTHEERFELVKKAGYVSLDENNDFNVPKRELSCSFTMRSNDFCCGNPFNIAQYAMLTEMLAHMCGMTVGELVYFGNDVHVYENHLELAKEQLIREGNETLAKLRFKRQIKNIEDFKFEDFIIDDYEPDSAIKYPLSVG